MAGAAHANEESYSGLGQGGDNLPTVVVEAERLSGPSVSETGAAVYGVASVPSSADIDSSLNFRDYLLMGSIKSAPSSGLDLQLGYTAHFISQQLRTDHSLPGHRTVRRGTDIRAVQLRPRPHMGERNSPRVTRLAISPFMRTSRWAKIGSRAW
jgi:hypothetical protein